MIPTPSAISSCRDRHTHVSVDSTLTAAVWGSFALVAYSYVIYPLLLLGLTRLRGEKSSPLPGASKGIELPQVVCIVAAYNEEQHIEARISNLLAQRYPPDRLSIHVGSDGSSDGTEQILRRLQSERVRAFIFEQNRGKASVLNDLVAAADAPILVMTDANTEFASDAVAQLMRHFADERVGCVCGELRLVGTQGSNQDSLYWRIEQYLKRSEARLGGLLGANGAIYAMRRELYIPLRSDTIIDDFCIAMSVAAGGHRLVYDVDAVASEDTPDDIGDEYVRRVRIGIGNYQAAFRHPEYLFGAGWTTGFCYFSHKVLRWFTPHLLACALLASLLLAPRVPAYAVLAALQMGIYLLGAALYPLRDSGRLPRVARLLVFFLALNWAFCVAFVRYLGGNYRGSWRRTTRAAAS